MVQRIAPLREAVRRWRAAGAAVGFVPTMGNLHPGHVSLVRLALERSQKVVASVFVNPTQFGENEDLAAYPRTLEEDADKLQAAGCSLLFAPGVDEVYPFGPGGATRVTLPDLADTLCGAVRPGHFDGVATVVLRLFHMVQPDLAVFGEKDFQQLAIIRRLVRDLALPVDIVGAPTVREPDGLAMSSRNAYLSAKERAVAPQLYQALQEVARRVAGGAPVPDTEAAALEALSRLGFRPDYVAVRRGTDLQPSAPGDRERRVFGAAWLGRARLIDNVPVPA